MVAGHKALNGHPRTNLHNRAFIHLRKLFLWKNEDKCAISIWDKFYLKCLNILRTWSDKNVVEKAAYTYVQGMWNMYIIILNIISSSKLFTLDTKKVENVCIVDVVGLVIILPPLTKYIFFIQLLAIWHKADRIAGYTSIPADRIGGRRVPILSV